MYTSVLLPSLNEIQLRNRALHFMADYLLVLMYGTNFFNTSAQIFNSESLKQTLKVLNTHRFEQK